MGKWENCKSVCNDMTLMKNVCSIMEFKNDQTLTISNSGKITESFKWKVEKNQITFKKLKTEENFSFSESKVYILFKTYNNTSGSLRQQGDNTGTEICTNKRLDNGQTNSPLPTTVSLLLPMIFLHVQQAIYDQLPMKRQLQFYHSYQ